MSKEKLISKKVTDHLANERTFLAWIRTGIAIMAFGFVVARFGLLLRELGLKQKIIPELSIHISSIVGITLVILGVVMTLLSYLSFLQVRASIDREEFHPQTNISLSLTLLSAIIGIILALYLAFNA